MSEHCVVSMPATTDVLNILSRAECCNRWATAAAHEQAELHTEWAAAMKAINRMVTTILQLAAASSTAFRVSK